MFSSASSTPHSRPHLYRLHHITYVNFQGNENEKEIKRHTKALHSELKKYFSLNKKNIFLSAILLAMSQYPPQNTLEI